MDKYADKVYTIVPQDISSFIANTKCVTKIHVPEKLEVIKIGPQHYKFITGDDRLYLYNGESVEQDVEVDERLVKVKTELLCNMLYERIIYPDESFAVACFIFKADHVELVLRCNKDTVRIKYVPGN